MHDKPGGQGRLGLDGETGVLRISIPECGWRVYLVQDLVAILLHGLGY